MDEKMLQTLEDSFDNIQEGCGPLSGSIAAAGGIELIAEVRRLRKIESAARHLNKTVRLNVHGYWQSELDAVRQFKEVLSESSTNEGK